MRLWLIRNKDMLRGVSPPQDLAEKSIFNTKFSKKNLREETKMLNLYFESSNLDSTKNYGSYIKDIVNEMNGFKATIG